MIHTKNVHGDLISHANMAPAVVALDMVVLGMIE